MSGELYFIAQDRGTEGQGPPLSAPASCLHRDGLRSRGLWAQFLPYPTVVYMGKFRVEPSSPVLGTGDQSPMDP